MPSVDLGYGEGQVGDLFGEVGSAYLVVDFVGYVAAVEQRLALGPCQVARSAGV